MAFNARCEWNDGTHSGSYGNIYVVNSDGANLTQITSNVAIPDMHVWDRGPEWSPDGAKLVFMHSEHSIDFSSNQFSIVTSNPDGSNRIHIVGPTAQVYTNPTWSPDGTKILCDGGDLTWSPNVPTTGILYVMDTNGDNLQPLPTETSAFRMQPEWQPIPMRSPNPPGKIVFQSGNDIFTINADGTDQTLLHVGGAPNMGMTPKWSVDGSRIVFAKDTPGYGGIRPNIFTINVDNLNVMQLTFSGTDWHPNFSPDGNQIVFVRSNDIWKMNVDGSNSVLLADLPCPAELPSWSPDGTRIAFDTLCDWDDGTNSGSYGNIFVMNSDGTNRIQITNNSAIADSGIWDWGADWSFDGTKLLFNRQVSATDFPSNEYSIVTSNPDGTNRQVILGPTPLVYKYANWSPDGKKILCDSGDNMYAMDADGTNITRIHVYPFGNFADWQPVPLPPPSSTSTGTLVPVEPVDPNTGTAPATIVFYSVTQSGDTTVISNSQGPPQPSGFQLGDPAIFYDISTTAAFAGSISLCFNWTEGQFQNENNIQLLHYENNAWQVITTSKNVETNQICGQTTSLSPFALFESGYVFTGFFQPVDNPPTRNTVKAGSAVPVKFSLGGNQGMSIFASGYPASQTIQCDTSAPLSAIEETVTAGGSSLSYDGVSDQYTYVWKTNKTWANTCRSLVLTFNDGTVKTADFSFSK